jgi:hypothetical protein
MAGNALPVPVQHGDHDRLVYVTRRRNANADLAHLISEYAIHRKKKAKKAITPMEPAEDDEFELSMDEEEEEEEAPNKNEADNDSSEPSVDEDDNDE